MSAENKTFRKADFKGKTKDVKELFGVLKSCRGVTLKDMKKAIRGRGKINYLK